MNANAGDIIRAMRGPVLLITFGTLMALSHTDKLGIGRSWPVLIIVYGIFKLLERMTPRPMPMPPPWPPHPPVGAYVPQQYPPPPQSYPPQQPQGGAQ